MKTKISQSKVFGSSGGSKGGAWDAPSPPWQPKFLHFHAFFGKNWQNHRLAPPPPGSCRPLLGEILDPPLGSVEEREPKWLLYTELHRFRAYPFADPNYFNSVGHCWPVFTENSVKNEMKCVEDSHETVRNPRSISITHLTTFTEKHFSLIASKAISSYKIITRDANKSRQKDTHHNN